MPPVVPQPVVGQLTRAAIFLVVMVNPGRESCAAVRSLCSDLSTLLRAVGFRDLDGGLSCVMAFGSDVWDRLFGPPRPKDLHPFREIRGRHHAVSTPGDILFHIRARRMDLCFELAMQVMARLDAAISTVDEVRSFTYFDDRDLIGFVDGTESPSGQAAVEATIIEHLVDGKIVWAPAIDGGLVVTTRSGDFELHIGQDISIGYLSHSETDVRLYLQETFTFLALTAEAAVVLAPPGK